MLTAGLMVMREGEVVEVVVCKGNGVYVSYGGNCNDRCGWSVTVGVERRVE